MRRALLLLTLPLLIEAPALAQDPVGDQVKRVRSVVIYGDDPCPKAENPDEIVVCARRPEEERYRLPPSTRDQATKNRKNRAWAARAREVQDLGRTAPSTCKPVGPGGDFGCAQQRLRDAAEEKAERTEAQTVPQPK